MRQRQATVSILLLTILYILPSCCILQVAGRRMIHQQNNRQSHRQYYRRPRLLFDDASTCENLEMPVLPHSHSTGDPSCPCLSQEQLAIHARRRSKRASEILGTININATDTTSNESNSTNSILDNYGLYCAPHDLYTKTCENMDECTTLTPLPLNCDKSFCVRSFCFVDTRNCALYHKPSSFFPELHYSYATCGYMDSFTYTERRKSLQGQTLQVALNSNTGGWMGAYNPEGSFSTTSSLWTGPIVEFLNDAAHRGGFQLNMTRPPAWLEQQANQFFGNSSFDYCIYATSLGYLDLCIGAYTITDKRASVVPFIELGSDPVYLVTFADDSTGVTYGQTLLHSLKTIFQPFTTGSWIMIAFVCLPLLGLLMLFHEYGTPGSAFPDEQEVITTNTVTGERGVKSKPIAMKRHIPKALYMSYLSFFGGSYDPVVITTGGKINLLAILSFVLLVLAVYTANLAAMLTQDASKSPIDTLEEAIKAKYTFCASRTVATRVVDLYGVDPNQIIPDPIHLGGDGKAGFNCPDCNARERIFDFMKNGLHETNDLYCHAALASYEDLQVLQRYGIHCNKTIVGDILAFRDFGIPITSAKAEEVMSWLYEMKYEGVLDRHMREAQPDSKCPEWEGEEGIALNVEQLLGIWFVVFGFAAAGVLTKIVKPVVAYNKKNGCAEERVHNYDQWSNPVENSAALQAQHGRVDNIDRTELESEVIEEYRC